MSSTLREEALAAADQLRALSEPWTAPGDPSRYRLSIRGIAETLTKSPSEAQVRRAIDDLRHYADELTPHGTTASAFAHELRAVANRLDAMLPGNTSYDCARAYLTALEREGYELHFFEQAKVSAFARGENGGYTGWLRTRNYDADAAEVVWLGRWTTEDRPVLGIAAKKRPVVLYERFLDGKKRCVGCAFANLAEFTPENGWCRVYDRPETGTCERCGGSVSRPYALFLDDRRERPPTAGPWLHAKSSHDALAAIERYGMPGFLSLDFDLGTGEVTGATFLRELVETYWLPRYYRKVYLPIPPLHAHTSYPEGAAEMIELHRTWRQIPSLP